MAEDDVVAGLWQQLVAQLNGDDRLTPQLLGFISLVEPKGILGETLYLEVPNELTREMIQQRMRTYIQEALTPLLGELINPGEVEEIAKKKNFNHKEYRLDIKKASFNDNRSTLYWNGHLYTNPNGKAQVEFYTGDVNTNYTISVTGITASGEIIPKAVQLQQDDFIPWKRGVSL